MRQLLFRAVMVVTLASVGLTGAMAQSGPAPASPQAGTAEPVPPRKPTEFQEAEGLPGGAGNPECVWVGRRAVNLLWRDDVDIAQRHIAMYERFGCPRGHLKAAFRCLIRQGPLDPKQPETLNAKVHACWINTELQPAEGQ